MYSLCPDLNFPFYSRDNEHVEEELHALRLRTQEKDVLCLTDEIADNKALLSWSLKHENDLSLRASELRRKLRALRREGIDLKALVVEAEDGTSEFVKAVDEIALTANDPISLKTTVKLLLAKYFHDEEASCCYHQTQLDHSSFGPSRATVHERCHKMKEKLFRFKEASAKTMLAHANEQVLFLKQKTALMSVSSYILKESQSSLLRGKLLHSRLSPLPCCHSD